jgi:hypothetical protein
MYDACMVALQIRDVPEETRLALTERAGERGQSLQGFLLDLVNAEAERSRNRAILARFEGRTDGARLAGTERTAALDAARVERDAALVGDRAAQHRRTA